MLVLLVTGWKIPAYLRSSNTIDYASTLSFVLFLHVFSSRILLSFNETLSHIKAVKADATD